MNRLPTHHWHLTPVTPERTAVALPPGAWRAAHQSAWRDGSQATEQHVGIRHTPAESDFTFSLAAAR